MKEKTRIIEDRWVWPLDDKHSFIGQKKQTEMHSIVMPYVQNRSVLVQAGGNCGMVLDSFVSYFDTVYTFEPDPVNFYCLNQNVTDPKVVKMQACLGYTKSPVDMTLLENSSDIGSFYVNGAGNYPVIRVDDLNLRDCGLIFLDVEGYEHEVLFGSIETIKKYKPVIFLEMHYKWPERYKSTSIKIKSFLESIYYEKVCNVHDFGDVNEVYAYSYPV
jgi:FkbM family methyltransferase